VETEVRAAETTLEWAKSQDS